MDAAPPHGAVLGDRSLFGSLEARAYLNHAAISPPSEPVRAAMKAVVDDFATRGVSAYLTWADQRERLRGRLAGLIGARAEDVGFVRNTSAGVSAVALGLPWQAGDRVVLFRGEFPANVTPWQLAAREHGVEVVWLEQQPFQTDPGAALQAVEDALRAGRVRVVAVSAVAFQTGLRLPWAELATLCHGHGAELFVDAIQACGVVPIDVVAEGIDYLAAGGHKWLMGPPGSGLLYVRPDRLEELRPITAGWMSHEDGLGFLFHGAGLLRYDRPLRRRADFVEGGMPDIWGCAGWEPAVEILEGLGVAAIAAHVDGYLERLEAGLQALGFESLRCAEPERRSGILSVLPPEPWDAVTLQPLLSERGIACSLPDGVLRFAPHWPNGLDEVELVLEAVALAMAERR